MGGQAMKRIRRFANARIAEFARHNVTSETIKSTSESIKASQRVSAETRNIEDHPLLSEHFFLGRMLRRAPLHEKYHFGRCHEAVTMLELGGRSFAAQHPLLSANLICGLVVGGLLSAAAVAQKSKAAPVSLGIEPISRFSGNVNAEDIGSQEMLEVSEVDASAKFVSVFTADAGLDVHEGDSVPQLQETLPTVRPLEKHESAVHEPIARLANERAEAPTLG